MILLLFALVVGTFTERRLTLELRLRPARHRGRPPGAPARPRATTTGDPVFTIGGCPGRRRAHQRRRRRRRDPDRRTRSQRRRSIATSTVDLGPPVEGVQDTDDFRVVTRPLFARFARPHQQLLHPEHADRRHRGVRPVREAEGQSRPDHRQASGCSSPSASSAARALALLAGLAVARRAMRPIAGLTRAAREVARHAQPGPAAAQARGQRRGRRAGRHARGHAPRARTPRARETEAALDRQREFVADASHELRTPLTSILANLELLEEELSRSGGPRDAAAAAETAGSALRSSKRMRRLVGDLLLLARADAGREAPRETLDVARIVREAAAEAGVMASGHPISLDLPPDGEALAEGSADDLHRLVLNLIENALLHTPSGTPVIASVRARQPGCDRGRRSRSRRPGRAARADLRALRPRGRRYTEAAVAASAWRSSGPSPRPTVGRSTIREAEGGGALFEVRLPACAPHPSAPDRVSSAELPATTPD